MVGIAVIVLRTNRPLVSPVPQAPHPAVASGARCGRKPLAEQGAVSVFDRTAVTSATSCRTSAWFGLFLFFKRIPIHLTEKLGQCVLLHLPIGGCRGNARPAVGSKGRWRRTNGLAPGKVWGHAISRQEKPVLRLRREKRLNRIVAIRRPPISGIGAMSPRTPLLAPSATPSLSALQPQPCAP